MIKIVMHPFHSSQYWLAVCFLSGILECMGSLAWADDISRLSDFSTSEIVRSGAFILQIGDRNTAAIDQGYQPWAIDREYVDIAQSGNDNKASTTQAGDVNRARISQDGSSNTATVSQSGFRNVIDIAQGGAGNTVVASQNGNDNIIVDSQSGGNQATLTEIGNNNSIVINQSQSQKSMNVSIKLNGGMSVKQNY